MIDTINSMSAIWSQAMIYAIVSGSIAIGVVGICCWLMSRRSYSAWARNWLWRLVAFKLLVGIVVLKPIAVPILAPHDSATTSSTVAKTTPLGEATGLVSSESILAKRPLNSAKSGPKRLAKVQFPGAPRPLSETNVTSKALPSWQSLLLVAWVIGIVINLCVFAHQFFRVIRIQMRSVEDPVLLATVKDLADKQHVRALPIGVSDQIDSPLLVGLFRPTIVFDPLTIRECKPEQIQSIVAHELAHFSRGDLWRNLLPAIVHALYFFHPLVWISNHRYRITSEMACDALAIRSAKQTPARYAASLLQVAAFGSNRIQSLRLLGAVAVFHSSRSLKQRIYAMKDARVISKRRAAVIACGVLIRGVLGAIPWQPVQRAVAADPPDVKTQGSIGENMGFDEKAESGMAKGWYGGGDGYKLRIDKSNARSGGMCGLIKGNSDSGFGTYTQCIDAKSLQGKRVVYRGYLKVI